MIPVNSNFRAQLAREKIVELRLRINSLREMPADNVKQQILRELFIKTLESDAAMLERQLENWTSRQGEQDAKAS
jgi:hypothetical protein